MGLNTKELPSRLQQIVLLVLAASLVAVGIAGGQWFMDADYIVYGPKVKLRDWYPTLKLRCHNICLSFYFIRAGWNREKSVPLLY